MSTSILKALPGKLDIKRHSPSILYIHHQQLLAVGATKYSSPVYLNENVTSALELGYSVKTVLGSHLKIDKTKVLKTNGSLMKVKSIAECSHGAFCNTFDLH